MIMQQQEIVTYSGLKWLTDKCLALSLILLFSPVFVSTFIIMGISMLMRPQDRGPWFYRERRISQGGEFDILKFRVVRQDLLERAEQEGKYSRIYEADVENLTWAGRYFLKRWYFDELPQLFNILKGDMSLVGPRPLIVSEVRAQIQRGFIYRNLIVAGWTGPAQVGVKGDDLQSGAETIDLEYLDYCRDWSVWKLWCYDMKILYETLRVMLMGKGLKY